MNAAVHACVIVLQQMSDRFDHRTRTVRGRGVVQVRQRAIAVQHPLENWEIGVQLIRIHHATTRTSGESSATVGRPAWEFLRESPTLMWRQCHPDWADRAMGLPSLLVALANRASSTFVA